VAKKLEDLTLKLREGESIQCKTSENDIWHRLSDDLENFENLKFRVKPNFGHIKRFDPVIVTFLHSMEVIKNTLEFFRELMYLVILWCLKILN